MRPDSWPRARGRFERPDRGGTDGHDPVGIGTRLPGRLGHDEAFGVHVVVFDPVGRDRLERAEADHEVDVDELSTRGPDAIEDGAGEVQASGGCGHGTGPAGVDGLVALGVGEALVDVGRQWDLAVAVERGQHVGGDDLDHASTIVQPFTDDQPQIGAGDQFGAWRHPSAGTDERLPLSRRDLVEQEHLDRAPGVLLQAETGREHPGVVDHDHVARPEEIGQIGHRAVLGNRPGTPVDQQPGGVARLDRMLGHCLVREVVIEVGRVHRTVDATSGRDSRPERRSVPRGRTQRTRNLGPKESEQMALRADDVDLGRDRDLVARYQSGDPSAFDDLYRCYFERLRRFCSRHTSDRHEAEEVAQEAFVKALSSMDSLDGERRFYPWMTVIAKRISIDRHRKYSRLELTDEPDLGSVDPDVDHLFTAVDAGHVRAALDRVGPRHREVLLLREAEQLSYADIAEHLDVPLTTVEALLHRARKALRREFAAVGGESRGVWGLPLFGWLTSKAAAVRSKVADHWIEIGAVAAPIAVGAATAAVVLLPGAGGSPDHDREVATAPTTVAGVPAPASGDDLLDLVYPSLPTPAAAATPAPPTSAAPAAPPAATAGPVDVFVGPEGTDRARDEAVSMPLGGEVGPTAGGADGGVAVDDAAAFVSDIADLLVGSADQSSTEQSSTGRSSTGPDTTETLLGGTP